MKNNLCMIENLSYTKPAYHTLKVHFQHSCPYILQKSRPSDTILPTRINIQKVHIYI